MSIASCIDAVLRAGGGHVSRDEAMAMLDEVDDRASRLSRDTGLPYAEATAQAAKQLTERAAATAAVERRNALLNLVTRATRRERLLSTVEQLGGTKGRNIADAMLNQIVARNRLTTGNRASAEAVWKGRRSEYGSALAVALNKAGLLRAFRSGSMERDWARELYELSVQSSGGEANVGRTGNTQALQIAQSIHGLQQLARERLNRQGAWIGNYAGYISRTAHDQDAIRRAGFEAWRSFVEPRLSEETFEGVGNRTEFLNETWKSLVDGVHLGARDPVGWKDPAFTGPGNAAKKLSQSRVLHWKNADAWLDYQKQFGHGTLPEQMMQTFDRASRSEALMSRWGTNPEAEFQQDFRWLEEHYHDESPEAVAKLHEAQKGIALRFSYLTGEANRPINKMAAEIGAGIRAVQSMAKLGGVAFTHLSAFATKGAELRYHGVGWLESYGDSLGALFTGRGTGETRELSDLLLAGMEGAHHGMLSRFEADDSVAGTMAKASNNFFRLSGLTWLLDAQKSATERTMSRHFGRHLDEAFDALPPEMQRTLTSYDISAGEWDALRGAPDHPTVDGRAHLTPDAAVRASDDAIQASLKSVTLPEGTKLRGTPEATDRALVGARDRLGMKVHTMFDDIASRGVITPGIEERYQFLGGNAPGSLAGEALRFVSQFKLWGAAAIRQGLGRELYGGQGKWGATKGMFQLALATGVMGYMTTVLKDLTKGLTPRNPLDPSTVMHSMIQGGGYGILGDYLFGEFGRFGQTPVESLAGPAAGTLADVLTMIATARGVVTRNPDAHPKDLAPEALRIFQNNTPFMNLFYVRKALDYLLFNSLQESLNPGYLRRAQRNIEKKTGQTYILPPSMHLHTFGR